MLEEAEDYISLLPSSAVGVVFLDGNKPVQPDLSALDRYQRNAGGKRGIWPSSPDISTAMLERYKTPEP